MTLLEERRLDPACGDERGSMLVALELVARGGLEFVETVGTEIGHRMTLHPRHRYSTELSSGA